jgi:hypothetical protein
VDDRTKILQTLRTFERAFNDKNAQAAGAVHREGEQAMKTRFDASETQKLVLPADGGITIKVTGSRATAQCTATLTIKPRNVSVREQTVQLRQFELEKSGDRWIITSYR